MKFNCELNNEGKGGGFVSLRAVICHGILKLLIGNNVTIAGTVGVVTICHNEEKRVHSYVC